MERHACSQQAFAASCNDLNWSEPNAGWPGQPTSQVKDGKGAL
jgi:hypothetical protein